jgi:hypothetical protein
MEKITVSAVSQRAVEPMGVGAQIMQLSDFFDY